MDKMSMRMIVAFCIAAHIQHSRSQLTSTLQHTQGDTITLSCSLTGTYTYPVWRGPPSLLIYTNQDDTSGQINPAAPVASRLSYAANNQDFILSNAEVADSGEYTCSYAGLGINTITLTVTQVSFTTQIDSTSIAETTITSTGTRSSISINDTVTASTATISTPSVNRNIDTSTVIGICVGGALFVLLIICIIVCCIRRSNSNQGRI